MSTKSHKISKLTPLGKHSPRLHAVRELAKRGQPGLALVDGAKLLLDLTAAGLQPKLVLLTPAQEALLNVSAPLAALAAAGKVFAVTDQTMERLAPSRHPQGALAVFPVPHRDPHPGGISLYLDRIQDPTNVGAIVRCAAALGASGVLCSAGCADPYSPRAVRAAAGQTLLFPVATNCDFPNAAAAHRQRNGQVVALAGRGGTPWNSWRPRLPLLLALGNEGSGVDPAVLRLCDVTVTIPLTGGVESLNVAVAAGIALAALGGLAPSPILE